LGWTLLQAVPLLFLRSLYFSMRSSLVCLMKKEYILYDNIDNIKEITEEKNMNCNLTNFRKIIYLCFTYTTVAGFCYCQFLLQFMDIYNNCFENPVNTSFSIYFQFIFCHNHPSLDSPLSILCQISHCHICNLNA
jgi:hypothetical protein